MLIGNPILVLLLVIVNAGGGELGILGEGVSPRLVYVCQVRQSVSRTALTRRICLLNGGSGNGNVSQAAW